MKNGNPPVSMGNWWFLVLTRQALVMLCVVMVMMTSSGYSQDRQRTKPFDDLGIVQQDKSPATVVQQAGIALESVVDPEKYFVGPSDIIAVNIWISPPVNLMLTVTPEGTLIIPSVGEVMVADLTLAKAKEKILREVRKKYLTIEVTATLSKPRPIVIGISGNVLSPGLLTMSAVDRANKAIDEANRLSRLQTADDLLPITREMSTRNIVLKHKDGSQDRVDIPKYFATHENKWNPYLREGDMIIVPKTNRLRNVFAVYGQVNVPGRYEFVEGDSVLDAIHIAYGLTRFAIADQAIFSRLNTDGMTLSTRTVNIPAMLEGREPNIALEPGDRIIVQGQNELRGDYNVDVNGEVAHPGTYPITRNHTRLSEIIRQAGGFTELASLVGATVVRRPYQPEEMDEEQLRSMRGSAAIPDSAGFGYETLMRVKEQAVAVDFEGLFLQKDSTRDIILQTEDLITIPSKQSTIYVFGQVTSPGHVPFAHGKDAHYYVTKAGGFTDRANGGSLTIINVKTKQWLSPNQTSIEAGDYIWVPIEPDRPFSYYMTIASQAASVLSVIIGVAVVVTQLTK